MICDVLTALLLQVTAGAPWSILFRFFSDDRPCTAVHQHRHCVLIHTVVRLLPALQFISNSRHPYIRVDVDLSHVCNTLKSLAALEGQKLAAFTVITLVIAHMWSAGAEIAKIGLGAVENKSDKMFTLYNNLGFVEIPYRKLPAIRYTYTCMYISPPISPSSSKPRFIQLCSLVAKSILSTFPCSTMPCKISSIWRDNIKPDCYTLFLTALLSSLTHTLPQASPLSTTCLVSIICPVTRLPPEAQSHQYEQVYIYTYTVCYNITQIIMLCSGHYWYRGNFVLPAMWSVESITILIFTCSNPQY